MKSAILLALMISLVSPANQKHNGESEADAKARYAVIADAIAREAEDDPRLALLLLVVARYESTFARSVHVGKVKGDQGRSWGLFQIMCGKRSKAGVPGTEYRAEEIVGVDELSTYRAVHAAAVHLRRHLATCKGNARCVFMNYGGVSKTAGATAIDRIEVRALTYHRLRQATKKDPNAKTHGKR